MAVLGLLGLGNDPYGSHRERGQFQPSACAIDSTWMPLTPRPPHLDERIAFQLREYAGMFRDPDASGDSNLVVQLTDVEKAPDALIVIRRELEQGLSNAPRHMRFIKVEYSYRQLRSWLECYMRGAGAGGITTWSIRTSTNRVALGIAAESLRPRVVEDIRRLGLPEEAFTIAVNVVTVGEAVRRPHRNAHQRSP